MSKRFCLMKKVLSLAAAVAMLLGLSVSCQEKELPAETSVTILCATGDADEITVNSATLKGTVLIGNAVAEKVDVWFIIDKDAAGLTTTGIKVLAGSTPASGGVVSAIATDLEPETTYYYQVCASIDGKQASGEVASFATLARPKEAIVTAEAAAITQRTALLYGYANLPENMSGVRFGIIYSTNENPSIDNGKLVESKEVDRNNKFFATVTGLQPATKYYYKAFLEVDGFYRVGEVKSITTLDFSASVTTEEATNVELLEATLNGTLIVESKDALSKNVWFLYSDSAKTLEDLKSSGKRLSSTLSEEGSFTERVSSLLYNTTYYYVACAEVHDKEFYGEVKQFSTKELLSEAVDMGLSVKWSSTNLGATKPEDYGGYYQWAGTEDVSDTSIYLCWDNCPYHTGLSYSSGWTKYITKSSYGTVDNKTTLEASDDAAAVNLGGTWRMPTDAEWTELRNSCTWTWTTLNGIKGYMVTSKKNGNSIFLPAAGYRCYDYLSYVGSSGYYWSSSLNTADPGSAYDVDFNSGLVYRDDLSRFLGQSVRPVSE